MSRSPRLTVVIPARNAETTIGEQIAALREQYDDTFDVILVDNASTDRTVEVAREHAGAMPLSVVAEGRLGANVGRNTGVRSARTEAVLLTDADDVVGEQWVSRMRAALASGTWVAGAVDFERLNSALTRDMRRRPHLRDAPVFLDTWGCNCGFNKSDWSAIGGFDERLLGWGDETDFFQRMSGAGVTGVRVPEAVVHYRLRPGPRSLLRDEFNIGVSHQRMVALGRSGGWIPTRSPIECVARGATHLVLCSLTWWSVRRVSRHLAGVAYHLGRISGWRKMASDE